MTTYYYILASKKFLTEEEPLEEVFRERQRNYREQGKEIDFWLVPQPAFLEQPQFVAQKSRCPQPAAAIISTNPQFIQWLKLRLEYVLMGQFTSEEVPNPLGSLAEV